MLEIVFIVLLLIVAVVAIGFARKFSGNIARDENVSDSRFARLVWRIIAAVAIVAAAIIGLASTVYTQGVGEAKVIINVDGTIAGEKLDPGFGVKAPWQSFVDYDLFSQELLYAGGDTPPSYSGGQVTGKEITVTVKGINGGSTQGNVDTSIVYSIDSSKVTALYEDYRNQERFTKQIVEKTVLTTVRDISPNYTAIEFRGDKRADATDNILKALNEKLNKLGVTVDFVSLQDVRYSPEVEEALKQVEVANQNVLKQEAELRATEISAQQKVVQAQAEADANSILNQSLTDQILQQRYIDKLGEGTIYIVPEGSTPFVSPK